MDIKHMRLVLLCARLNAAHPQNKRMSHPLIPPRSTSQVGLGTPQNKKPPGPKPAVNHWLLYVHIDCKYIIIYWYICTVANR